MCLYLKALKPRKPRFLLSPYDTNRYKHKIERVRVLGINMVTDGFVPMEENGIAGGSGT
jgi:hypothetical protein